jgi:hypothetical protein
MDSATGADDMLNNFLVFRPLSERKEKMKMMFKKYLIGFALVGALLLATNVQADPATYKGDQLPGNLWKGTTFDIGYSLIPGPFDDDPAGRRWDANMWLDGGDNVTFKYFDDSQFPPGSSVTAASLPPGVVGFSVEWFPFPLYEDAFTRLHAENFTRSLVVNGEAVTGLGDWGTVFYNNYESNLAYFEFAPGSSFSLAEIELFSQPIDCPNYYRITFYHDPNVVPEPATLALMGLGIAGLGLARRRLKK